MQRVAGDRRASSLLRETQIAKLVESADELIDTVDKRDKLQTADLGKKWFRRQLRAEIVDASPDFVDNIEAFVSGYLERTKAELENTKYADRVSLAVSSLFISVDSTTDWMSAILLLFGDAGDATYGRSLLAVLVLHKLIEMSFLYFAVYGEFHVDLVYSLFQVKGIVAANRVISNQQVEGALLDSISVLFVMMINDMCIESTPQVSLYRCCGRRTPYRCCSSCDVRFLERVSFGKKIPNTDLHRPLSLSLCV